MIVITTHLNPFSKSSLLLLSEVKSLVKGMNTPPPFEEKPDDIPVYIILDNVNEIISRISKSVRKGMMINSDFRAKIEGDSVHVLHVRNTNQDRLFISLKKDKNQ